MQSIYLNNKKFIDEVEVAVYDTDFRMLYHDALQNDIIKETPEMIERILQKKEIDFYIEDYQGVGIIYTSKVRITSLPPPLMTATDMPNGKS